MFFFFLSRHKFLAEVGFFEFIPESSLETNKVTPVYHLGELRIGERYEVVSTMATGLYRYRTGDVIEIVSLEEDGIPTMKLCYRLSMLSNLFGEKVGSQHIDSVVRSCREELEREVIDSVLMVNSDSNGYVIWLEVGGTDESPPLSSDQRNFNPLAPICFFLFFN